MTGKRHETGPAVPDRLDVLLMRVLDGEATADEREELMAAADADARLASLGELRGLLREALMGPAEREALVHGDDLRDVVGAVMAALAEQGDVVDDWAALAGGLKAAFESLPSPDVVEGVMATVLATEMATEMGTADQLAASEREDAILSALHDGELDAARRIALAERLASDRGALDTLNEYAEMGRLLREVVADELREAELDAIWQGVAPAIGLNDSEEVPGWAPIGEAVRDAVLDMAQLSEVESVAMTERVMAGLPRRAVAPEPEEVIEGGVGDWRQWLPRLAAPALVLAACLLAVLPGFWSPPTVNSGLEDGELAGGPDDAIVDDGGQDVALLDGGTPADEAVTPGSVQVESLEYADDVVVQVLQFDDEGPVFLMIDEFSDEDAIDGTEL